MHLNENNRGVGVHVSPKFSSRIRSSSSIRHVVLAALLSFSLFPLAQEHRTEEPTKNSEIKNLESHGNEVSTTACLPANLQDI